MVSSSTSASAVILLPDFADLPFVWQHSSLPVHRKVSICKTLVESKLMYGLSCLCLSAAERRCLDGFQNRCLRRINGIPPSFLSRIPVFEKRGSCF